MGERAKQVSVEDELGALLDTGDDGNDAQSELDALIAAPRAGAAMPFASPEDPPVMPEPGFWQRALNAYDNVARASAPSPAEQEGLQRQAGQALRTAAEHPVASFGAPIASGLATAFGGAPTRTLLGTALNQGASALAQGTADSYGAAPERGLSDALREGGSLSWKAAALALGLGGAGRLAGAGADRARMASTNTTADDLRELEMTPRQYAQRTEDLGINRFGREAKLDAVESGLEGAGHRQADAIANADAAGVGKYRDWGGEIARDLDQNAQNVWHGGGRREPIVGQMAKLAASADDHPMETLAALRQYKTARASEAYKNALGGLNETDYGKAALAASDSATAHLDNAMYSSGPENYAAYRNANRDFGDLAAIQEMLDRGTPRAGMVGDMVASGVGAAAGGPMGAAMGYAARRAALPYAADVAASGLGGIARNASAASRVTGTSTALADLALAAGKDPSQIDMQELEDFVRASQER